MAIFAIFAVVTQVQFSRLSNEKIYQARLDTFQSDERAYDVAIRAHQDCIGSIATREAYRGIFTGISDLFEQTANLPAELFPLSPEASVYETELLSDIDELINTPVKENLPVKTESDCPTIPLEKPERPTR